jgi:hypothetical protein
MDPDLIKEVIGNREDLPQYVKDLLEWIIDKYGIIFFLDIKSTYIVY